MKRVAGEFSFALRDREFAFILSGELVRSESQRFSGVVGYVTDAEGVAHFHATRARVISKQDVADCGLQFLVRSGVGGGVSGGAGRTGPLSAAVVFGLAPLWTVT
eukprot:5683534-Pleurochrysis_carterae.AAC.1